MHLFLKVVELDEHTCSSYEGQFSLQTQRASNESNALQTAKYSQVTFMHGSSSVEYKPLYNIKKQKLISLAANRILSKACSRYQLQETTFEKRLHGVFFCFVLHLIRLMKWAPAHE